jgi:hypothetical protein
MQVREELRVLPHRSTKVRFGGLPRYEVPMEMSRAVSQQLVVQFHGLERSVDALGDEGHFLKEQ